MYFPNAFRKSFLVSSGTLASGVDTRTLTAGQIGMYAPTSAINPAGPINSTLATVAAGVTPFYVVQGSYFTNDKIGSHGGYTESIKSKLVNPKYISRVMLVTSKKAVNQVVKVVANGTGLTSDETYRLRVDLKGSPALRFLSHNLYRTVDFWSGCINATNPTFKKDPVLALLAWKDQINTYPLLDQMVKARVYKYVAGQSATGAATVAAAQATIPMSTTTNIVVGQKAVGTGIPANAFVTTVTASTSIVIKYPTQATTPTIANNVAVQFFTDVYTEAGTLAYIPGTTTATGLTSTAYSADADAASFTYVGKPHIELTMGYVETSFQTCTFTPTDKYELEPLVGYAAVVDESGDPCLAACFDANAATISATNPYLSSHGIEVQAPVQSIGIGETVLREMILDGRYLQNAYPDSSRVDSLRMRQLEADPALSAIDRTLFYNKVLVLHNVPRWNNPSGTFDNDQYLLVFNVVDGTATTAITNYFVTAANAAQGASTIALESY